MELKVVLFVLLILIVWRLNFFKIAYLKIHIFLKNIGLKVGRMKVKALERKIQAVEERKEKLRLKSIEMRKILEKLKLGFTREYKALVNLSNK